MPTLETIKSLERWDVTADGESKGPATIRTITELRCYLYSKFQSDISDLPPKAAALKYNICRCHYIALILRKSLLTMQERLSPLIYGWENYGDTYKAIMEDELPAPIALIELSVCTCKTKCVGVEKMWKRCKCRKNKLQCTDMCKCINCANDDTQEQLDEEDELILDDKD